MNYKSNGALIFIASDFANGLETLQNLVFQVTDFVGVVGSSSIYKRYQDIGAENFNSELVVAIRAEVALSHQQLQERLSKISSSLSLLAYNQEVNLYPGKNLPHPDLHSDSLTLRCAAEAWGAYEHPVLGQTLNELVRSDDKFEKIEFFAQGRAIGDYL